MIRIEYDEDVLRVFEGHGWKVNGNGETMLLDSENKEINLIPSPPSQVKISKGQAILLLAWIERNEPLQPDNMPPLPRFPAEIWNEIMIPNITRLGGIAKNKLIVGAWYEGECRNASRARWNGQGFTYLRTKWGSTYEESINHYEDDNGFDLFVPLRYEEKQENQQQ